MARIGKYIYISLLAITLLTPHHADAVRGIAVRPVSPSGTEAVGNQWLFVIGIDTYIDWPRLNTAVNDAKAVRDILLLRYHFDKDHLIEVYDEQATRKNIFKKLRYLAKKVREHDSLVIFYAGHGHFDSITKAGSWIPVESGTGDVSAWIANHDIKNYLRVDAIKAKHILLISDSCFSGDFFRGHRGKLPDVTDEVVKKAYKLTSRQAITSGGLEPVADEGFGRNSVFSHFLVRTLKENQKPFLLPSDFFLDIKAGVAENAEQFPRFGSLKDTGGQQGGEIVLFLKQDARLEALKTETAESQRELERLQQIEVAAEEARKKEAEEVARREKKLAELDAKIEAMRKRLGTSTVRTDDSLDAMLSMVRQKEAQEKKLQELRRQSEDEEAKRQAEIARLKRDSKEKIIAMLTIEVDKYKEIVASKYGQSMKSEAWRGLIAKCPSGWADGVEEGDCDALLRVYHSKIGGQTTENESRMTTSSKAMSSFGSDDFSNTRLGPQWKWINEDSNCWSLRATRGSMRITTQNGDIWRSYNTAKNLLLQNASGNWTINTKLVFSDRPSENWQQAGLVVYQDDDNYLKLVRVYNHRNEFQFGKEVRGRYSQPTARDNIMSRTVYLKITKEGNNYSAYFSADGTEYTQVVPTHSLNLRPVKVGLIAINGPASVGGLNADFDYFNILY